MSNQALETHGLCRTIKLFIYTWNHRQVYRSFALYPARVKDFATPC